jgi:hypothetical protein
MGKFVQVAMGRLIVCGNPKCLRLFTSVPKPYSTGRFCSRKCACSYSTSINRNEISLKVSSKLKGCVSNKKGKPMSEEAEGEAASHLEEEAVDVLTPLSSKPMSRYRLMVLSAILHHASNCLIVPCFTIAYPDTCRAAKNSWTSRSTTSSRFALRRKTFKVPSKVSISLVVNAFMVPPGVTIGPTLLKLYNDEQIQATKNQPYHQLP